MTDLEKVIKGMEYHSEGNCFKSDDDETGCPYWKDSFCSQHLCSDALALLKAHEPQVMSIGDLYGYDMGFYERRDEEIVWPVLISRGGPDDDETVGFVRKDGYELRSDCGLMNITWRIWTTYPPHELREATPWQ